jgi:hypothetical protein
MANHDFLVGVIELDRKLGGEDRFCGRRSTSIVTNSFCRQARLCPLGDHGNLAVDNIGDIGITDGDTITILRGGGGGVQVFEVVGRLGVISMLTVIYIALLGCLRIVLQEER